MNAETRFKSGFAWLAGFFLVVGCSAKDAVIQVGPVDPYVHPEFSSLSKSSIPGAASSSVKDVVGDIPNEFLCKDENGKEKVLVCHKGKKTLCLPKEALFGHLGRDDFRKSDHEFRHEDEECDDDGDQDSDDEEYSSKERRQRSSREYKKKECKKHNDSLGPCGGGGGSGSSSSSGSGSSSSSGSGSSSSSGSGSSSSSGSGSSSSSGSGSSSSSTIGGPGL
ncbi:MAG: hypothetical protein KGP28_06430 [Bdellovibrionales bacterium]|nr:hypothetical protein [Bdellovibrionales bacterium]